LEYIRSHFITNKHRLVSAISFNSGNIFQHFQLAFPAALNVLRSAPIFPNKKAKGKCEKQTKAANAKAKHRLTRG